MTSSTNPNDAYEIGKSLAENLAKSNIIILPLSSQVTSADIRSIPSCAIGPVIACDFKVEGIETGTPIEKLSTYSLDGIINIDHHAALESMYRQVSSANLAIEYVNCYGPVDLKIPIVINHYDCDSVLSCLLMRGLIPPSNIFGEAAIAADHTGEPNPIADLLQSLKDNKDFVFSTQNLFLLLSNLPLEPQAQESLGIRLATRDSLASLPAIQFGDITLIKTNGRVDAELFPGLYPESKIIMSYHLLTDDKSEVRLRLGKSAPLGLNLQQLPIKNFDPGFGGRWNAGSNERGGGTSLAPEVYCQKVLELLCA